MAENKNLDKALKGLFNPVTSAPESSICKPGTASSSAPLDNIIERLSGVGTVRKFLSTMAKTDKGSSIRGVP